MAIQQLTDAVVRIQTLDTIFACVKSYINQHATTLANFISDAANALVTDNPMISGDYQDKLVAIEQDDATGDVYAVRLEDVAVAVNHALYNTVPEDDIPVRVWKDDYANAERPLSEILDRLRDSMSLTSSLTGVLDSMVSFAHSSASDIRAEVARRLETLSIGDNIRHSIQASLDSVFDSVSNLQPTDALGLLPSVLAVFGIRDGLTRPISYEQASYNGINALLAVTSDYFEGLATFCSNAKTFIANAFVALFGALVKGSVMLLEKYTYWVAKIYNFITSQDDGIMALGYGDGSISINYSYTLSGSWQGQYIENALSSMNSDLATVFGPFGTFYVEKTENGIDQLSFVPKVLNYEAVRSVLYSVLHTSNLLPWRADNGHMVLATTPGIGHGPAITLDVVKSLLQAILEKKSEILSVPDHYNDAEKLEGIYWSQYLSCLLLDLFTYSRSHDESEWNATQSFADISDALTEGLFSNWALFQAGSFEPANYHFGVLACSMSKLDTAWAYLQGGSIPDRNVNSFSSSDPNQRYPMLNSLAKFMKLCWDGTSVKEGTSQFMPYLPSIMPLHPSWALKSDETNYQLTAGALRRGLIIAGVIVLAAVAITVFAALKRKSFALAAQAGSYSWAAAESGDSALMAKAYKLQKRSTLLSRLVGSGAAIAQNSIDFLPTLNRLGKSIDPDF